MNEEHGRLRWRWRFWRRTRAQPQPVMSGQPQPPMSGAPRGARDRFDQFTQRARQVLSLSQEEAVRLNHNYIGTEHLLLGLIREGDGVAARVLARLGVTLEDVRRNVEFIIGHGDRVVLGEVGLTPRAKKVIRLAEDEAGQMGHHYVGTEHLLLGLVREGEGIAADVLKRHGLSLARVRQETLRALEERGAGPDANGEQDVPPRG